MSYHVPRRQIYVEKKVTIFKETQYCRACSKRSNSGERCEVKKAIKSRGGLGTEVRELTSLSLSHLAPSLAFIFSRSFLLRTAPHYLNAWNRLNIVGRLYLAQLSLLFAVCNTPFALH